MSDSRLSLYLSARGIGQLASGFAMPCHALTSWWRHHFQLREDPGHPWRSPHRATLWDSKNRIYFLTRHFFADNELPDLSTYHLATCILPDCSFVTKILLPRDETYFVGWHIQSDIM